MPLFGADLASSAKTLLDLLTAELEAAGVSIPDLAYVAPGGVLIPDGEQLVVLLGRLGEGAPGSAVGGFTVPDMTFRHVEFNVCLLRKVASLDTKSRTPSASAINADGMTTMGDSINLFDAGQAIKNTYAVAEPLQPIIVGPLTPWGPEGGLAGSQLEMAWTLL